MGRDVVAPDKKIKIPAGALIGTMLAVITCFHFFRVIFIILTLPIIYKYVFR